MRLLSCDSWLVCPVWYVYFLIQPSRFGFACSNRVWMQRFAHVKPASYTPSLSSFHPPPWFCVFFLIWFVFYLDFYWECFTKLPGRPKTQDSPSSSYLISHVWSPLSDPFTNVLPIIPAPHVKRRPPFHKAFLTFQADRVHCSRDFGTTSDWLLYFLLFLVFCTL